MNYNITDTTIAEPCASSMILTFRAIGYNLEAAVADIIDNSISEILVHLFNREEREFYGLDHVWGDAKAL